MKKKDMMIGKIVAFRPEAEDWMSYETYKDVYNQILFSRIIRRRKMQKTKQTKKKERGETHNQTEETNNQTEEEEIYEYEVRWWFTQYQGLAHIHFISKEKVLAGVEMFKETNGRRPYNAITWKKLCVARPEDVIQLEGLFVEDFEEDEYHSDVRGHVNIPPRTIQEVEKKLTGLSFIDSTHAKLDRPSDLYEHPDGGATTKLKPDAVELFRHSAISSFLAYIPLAFWNNTVHQSNVYASEKRKEAKDSSKAPEPITLPEMMKFLGCLFYMATLNKGEYTNCWGTQIEDLVFGLNSSICLDNVLPLRRFKYIRENFCFRANVSREQLKEDPVARIRPLLNILKQRCRRFVIPGRELSVDEATVACRSKFARHMILYNPRKPTGKFHFKIYALCCATNWILLNFKIHCSATTGARLDGVMKDTEIQGFEEATKFCAETRKHVYEVVLPFHNSKRVVTTDNYYTSAQLLLGLQKVGLYGRGTIRTESAHFPRCIQFSKKDEVEKGEMNIACCAQYRMVAASWVDRNIVNVVSTADGSGTTHVFRQVGGQKKAFPSPACISNYNINMQGVDRFDQLRAKFSIANGHSFRKWYKKLALAFIDFARANAFLTRSLAMKTTADDEDDETEKQRGAHLQFIAELIKALFFGGWKDALNESYMQYGDEMEGGKSQEELSVIYNRRVLAVSTNTPPGSPIPPPQRAYPLACKSISSAQFFDGSSRWRRGCKVCRYENRHGTVKTDYCITHDVSLCRQVYPLSRPESFHCPETTWTCWDKFHLFYLPRGAFNSAGNQKRSGYFYERKQEAQQKENVCDTLSIRDLSESTVFA